MIIQRFNSSPDLELTLNGCKYGLGDNEYMIELLTDYIVSHDMYCEDKAIFEIERLNILGNVKRYKYGKKYYEKCRNNFYLY